MQFQLNGVALVTSRFGGSNALKNSAIVLLTKKSHSISLSFKLSSVFNVTGAVASPLDANLDLSFIQRAMVRNVGLDGVTWVTLRTMGRSKLLRIYQGHEFLLKSNFRQSQ